MTTKETKKTARKPRKAKEPTFLDRLKNAEEYCNEQIKVVESKLAFWKDRLGTVKGIRADFEQGNFSKNAEKLLSQVL